MNFLKFKYLLIIPNIFGVHWVLHGLGYFSLYSLNQKHQSANKGLRLDEWVGRTASMQKFFSDYRNVLSNYIEKKLQQGILLQNT